MSPSPPHWAMLSASCTAASLHVELCFPEGVFFPALQFAFLETWNLRLHAAARSDLALWLQCPMFFLTVQNLEKQEIIFSIWIMYPPPDQLSMAWMLGSPRIKRTTLASPVKNDEHFQQRKHGLGTLPLWSRLMNSWTS